MGYSKHGCVYYPARPLQIYPILDRVIMDVAMRYWALFVQLCKGDTRVTLLTKVTPQLTLVYSNVTSNSNDPGQLYSAGVRPDLAFLSAPLDE